MIAHEQGICGCHVHVEVPDRESAIAVSNRLRPWLPLLLALAANSAIYRNADTGYASWRSVLWARWPSAGPPPHLDSAAHYDAVVAMMLESGAMLDDRMVYWDVRPSSKFPTLEVRVADVPATAAETVLMATLVRASVMTALAAHGRGEPVPRIDDHAARRLLEGRPRRARRAGDRRLRPLGAGSDRPGARAVAGRAAAGARRTRRRRMGARRTRPNPAGGQWRDAPAPAWRERGDVADVLASAAAATLR